LAAGIIVRRPFSFLPIGRPERSTGPFLIAQRCARAARKRAACYGISPFQALRAEGGGGPEKLLEPASDRRAKRNTSLVQHHFLLESDAGYDRIRLIDRQRQQEKPGPKGLVFPIVTFWR